MSVCLFLSLTHSFTELHSLFLSLTLYYKWLCLHLSLSIGYRYPNWWKKDNKPTFCRRYSFNGKHRKGTARSGVSFGQRRSEKGSGDQHGKNKMHGDGR